MVVQSRLGKLDETPMKIRMPHRTRPAKDVTGLDQTIISTTRKYPHPTQRIDLKKNKAKPAAGRATAPGSTWQSAVAILVVLATIADAAFLLYSEWQHFGNPDMGSLLIAAAVLGAALCGAYSLFTRQRSEKAAMALLGLCCVVVAHLVLQSGRLNYRAPCEAGKFECARTGLHRTSVRFK